MDYIHSIPLRQALFVVYFPRHFLISFVVLSLVFDMVSSALIHLLLTAAVSASAFPRDFSHGASGRLSFPITRARRDLPLSRRTVDNNVPLLNQSSISYLIERKCGTSRVADERRQVR